MTNLAKDHKCGIRGCSGRTNRNGKERFCAQSANYEYQGKRYCRYHNPKNPKKFGE